MPELAFIMHPFDENTVELSAVPFTCKSENAARHRAGALAKRNNGPVDLAWAGDESWADRYITTASPSPYHVAGYACQKIG